MLQADSINNKQSIVLEPNVVGSPQSNLGDLFCPSDGVDKWVLFKVTGRSPMPGVGNRRHTSTIKAPRTRGDFMAILPSFCATFPSVLNHKEVIENCCMCIFLRLKPINVVNTYLKENMHNNYYNFTNSLQSLYKRILGCGLNTQVCSHTMAKDHVC